MSVLVCDNLTKINQNHNSIKNFSYNFLDNKVYGIIGKSDSGKETLLDLMTAKVYPTEGCVYLDGEILTNKHFLSSKLCFILKKLNLINSLQLKQSSKKCLDIFLNGIITTHMN